MQRRWVLRGLLGGLLGGFSLCALGGPAALLAASGTAAAGASADAASGTVSAPTAVPVLMFHKVDDTPRYPEDIASAQLAAVLDHAWRAGFRPVNVSDLLHNRLDAVVPQGLKPLCITADDSHPSVVFSRTAGKGASPRNAYSLADMLRHSLAPYNCRPRASFFLTSTSDDRAYTSQKGSGKGGNGYFGGARPLEAVLDILAEYSGPTGNADSGFALEAGYHTRTHVNMGKMDAARVRAVLEDQMRDFERLGVLQRIERILAYPYGVRPAPEGIAALRDLGFTGAVLAYPGVNEARYTDIPACRYDGALQTDPFLIPRVNIGAYLYAPKTGAGTGRYAAVDPLEDFRKDVERALPHIYVSRGNTRA